MTTTEAQQLDRCAKRLRTLRTAEESLALDDPRRIAALMAARDEIDATIRVLRWRPRPRVSTPAVALLSVCVALFVAVGLKTVVLLTEGRPAVEVRK
jgi:uncharacterized protein involved in response to NO